jgi:NTE family protein
MKSDGSAKNSENEGFEHVIRYEDGINSDFVLASCSVPVNYDYTRLNVQTRTLAVEGQGGNSAIEDNIRSTSTNDSTNLRFFWDGGLLANTPLRQTIIAHRDYWLRVKKLEDNLPILKFGIINLHPAKQEYVPYDYDSVVDRKNDIIYHDKTEFDEFVAVLISDYVLLAKSLRKLAEENGASKDSAKDFEREN